MKSKLLKINWFKQANDAKKAENKAIREKQRKECKRKQHEMERLQKRVPKGFKVYEKVKVNRLTVLASLLNAAVQDFYLVDGILAALGAPPVEPEMYQEQQASILKLKKKNLDNNHLDTKCYQCPEDRPAFPSWSALEIITNTRHLKDPKHKCDYEGCNKVVGNR